MPQDDAQPVSPPKEERKEFQLHEMIERSAEIWQAAKTQAVAIVKDGKIVSYVAVPGNGDDD